MVHTPCSGAPTRTDFAAGAVVIVPSVARTLKFDTPVFCADPEKQPLALSVSPAGGAPLAMAHVTGPLPPVEPRHPLNVHHGAVSPIGSASTWSGWSTRMATARVAV